MIYSHSETMHWELSSVLYSHSRGRTSLTDFRVDLCLGLRGKRDEQRQVEEMDGQMRKGVSKHDIVPAACFSKYNLTVCPLELHSALQEKTEHALRGVLLVDRPSPWIRSISSSTSKGVINIPWLHGIMYHQVQFLLEKNRSKLLSCHRELRW